jgi:hypothetical protein
MSVQYSTVPLTSEAELESLEAIESTYLLDRPSPSRSGFGSGRKGVGSNLLIVDSQ